MSPSNFNLWVSKEHIIYPFLYSDNEEEDDENDVNDENRVINLNGKPKKVGPEPINSKVRNLYQSWTGGTHLRYWEIKSKRQFIDRQLINKNDEPYNSTSIIYNI